jgi:hypothetical protein
MGDSVRLKNAAMVHAACQIATDMEAEEEVRLRAIQALAKTCPYRKFMSGAQGKFIAGRQLVLPILSQDRSFGRLVERFKTTI